MKGDGNQYDYGFRIYDPRLGRFLSVDPLFKGYPWYTPYQFAGNMPIWAIDLDGLEEMKKNSVANVIKDIKGDIVTKPTVINDPTSSADAIPGVRRLNPNQIEVTPGLINKSHRNWNTFTWQQVNGKDFSVGQTNTPIGQDAGGTVKPPKTNLEQDNDDVPFTGIPQGTTDIKPVNSTEVKKITKNISVNIQLHGVNIKNGTETNLSVGFQGKEAAPDNFNDAEDVAFGIGKQVKNTNVKIDVKGYVLLPANGSLDDVVPDKNYTYRELAQKRTDYIKDRLIKNGANPKQIKTSVPNTGHNGQRITATFTQ